MRRSQTPKCSTPRLACVRPAASVHPEPGSNSPLYRRSLMLFLFSRPGLICAIFPKKIYLKTSVSLYACFPVLFILGTIASKNARTSVRLYLSPPASAGGVFYLILSFIPSLRFGSAKVATFSFPPTLSPKKFFLFSQPPQPLAERR